MNNSEADCLGLLVRRSGQDTVLYLCVINASHFPLRLVYVYHQRERGLSK